jgi:hypothetical protein
MYAGAVERSQAAEKLVESTLSCAGGQGSASERPINGTAAPINPAEVIKKSLRVAMFTSPGKAQAAIREGSVPW